LAAPKGKVIDAYDSEVIALVINTPTNHPQQCVVAHRHHQAVGKSRRRSAAERQTKVVDDCLQQLGAPTVTSQRTAIELFAEDSSATQNGIAPEPTRHDR
jgi:hypothetical protein